MSDSKTPAIRARLRYATIAEFKAGYSKFVSTGGMFIPMPEAKLKPVGTEIRFQFMLHNGDTVLLGKGVVLQVREKTANSPNSPIGILVKFTKLSQDSKRIIDEIVDEKDNQKIQTSEINAENEARRHTIPTPAAVVAIDPVNKAASDISEDRTVVGTLDDIFEKPKSASLDERTAVPDKPVKDPGTQEENIFQEGAEESEPSFELPKFSENTEVKSLEEETPAAEVSFEGLEEKTPVEMISEVADKHESLKKEMLSNAFEAGKKGSNIRIISYDDMSVVQPENLNFSFGGDESEIDDMFDDLFGTSTNSNSFFEEVLGSNAVKDDSKSESDAFVPKTEPLEELIEEGVELEEPVEGPKAVETLDDLFEDSFSPDDTPSPDDSLSLEDAFESEPEEESLEILNVIEEKDENPFDLINEVYSEPSDEELEDENPFRPDPPSIELSDSDLEEQLENPSPNLETFDDLMLDPELVDAELPAQDFSSFAELDEEFGNALADEESSLVELDLVKESSAPAYASFDDPSFAAENAVSNAVSNSESFVADVPDLNAKISRHGELDDLLGALENDDPVGRNFDLSHESEPLEIGNDTSDIDSLETLLALANKYIKAKEKKSKNNDDILDQLLGEDLPPPPEDIGFTMPTPEDSGKKKSLLSKFFGKE